MHHGFIVTVHAASKERGTAPDKASILPAPFHVLLIARGGRFDFRLGHP